MGNQGKNAQRKPETGTLVGGRGADGKYYDLLVGTDGSISVLATSEMAAEATAAAPTYTEGQNAPLSQDLRGQLRTIASRRQYAGVPSSAAILTADGTVFTLAANEIGFIQVLSADAPLAVKLGASASTSSLHFVLSAGTAASDGKAGAHMIDYWTGVVSVAKMTGTSSYLAWKVAIT